jgi:hypothetical protein
MKMEQTQYSETSAIKHHKPENNPKGYTRHSEHGESLNSGMKIIAYKINPTTKGLVVQQKYIPVP